MAHHLRLKNASGLDADANLSGATSRLEKALLDNNLQKGLQLIRIGANVNFKDIEDRTPLMAAAEGSTPEACKFLINHGARLEDRDSWGKTAYLHAAKVSKDPKVLELLEEMGCNIYARTGKYNDTALFLAAEYNSSVKIIKYLLQKGFYPDNNDDMYRYTPIMAAVRFNKNPLVIKYLLSASSEYDLEDKGGDTALMHTAYREDDDPSFFLQVYNFFKKTDPKSIKERLFKRNKKGKNVMDIAISNGNVRIAEEIEGIMNQYE